MSCHSSSVESLTKVCTKCGREKHWMEFYLDYRTGRRATQCKACKRARGRQYYAQNAPQLRARSRARRAADPERERELDREWRSRRRERRRTRERERELGRERRRRYNERYPRRAIVREVSRGLVKLGFIEVGDRCVDCGSPDVELHHPDYGNPFWVVPLCRRCHMARHWSVWWREGGGPVK